MKIKKTIVASSLAAALVLVGVGTVSAQTTGVNGSTNTSLTSPSTNSTTDTSGVGVSSTTTPGVPNTGAGGNAAINLMILATTGAAALAGGTVLLRKYAQ